jgi:hypothetical protein
MSSVDTDDTNQRLSVIYMIAKIHGMSNIEMTHSFKYDHERCIHVLRWQWTRVYAGNDYIRNELQTGNIGYILDWSYRNVRSMLLSNQNERQATSSEHFSIRVPFTFRRTIFHLCSHSDLNRMKQHLQQRHCTFYVEINSAVCLCVVLRSDHRPFSTSSFVNLIFFPLNS